MNGNEHYQIGLNSVSYLPELAAGYWGPLKELLGDASNFPDIFWRGEESSPEYLEKFPEWRDYILIPLKSGTVNCHSAFDPLRFLETYPPVVEYLVSGALNAMKLERKEAAAKFVGVMSHIIGDTGQAAHVYDPMMLSELFQKSGDSYLLHTLIENNPDVVYPPHSYSAQCLGATSRELQWRLIQNLAKLKNRSIGTIVPIMNALLNDDSKTAAQYASATVGECSDLFSDLLYSLYLLHSGTTVPLEDIKLTELEADCWHCDGMFNFMPQKDRIPGRRRFDSSPLDIGNGFRSGLALLPDMFPGCAGGRVAFTEYRLPRNVFKTFSAFCGLNRNSLNETGAVFEILLDDEKVWQSEKIFAEREPLFVKLNLRDAERIRIQVRDAREDTFATRFFYPCYVEPVLHRS